MNPLSFIFRKKDAAIDICLGDSKPDTLLDIADKCECIAAALRKQAGETV